MRISAGELSCLIRVVVNLQLHWGSHNCIFTSDVILIEGIFSVEAVEIVFYTQLY